ncbi:MAG: hypothetical protein DI598_19755 [Pseudopedobacter saltans]|uniref:Uncharacterized protein n=1 Tax=Pseudopedobacter saltans TaxID=151895 RepID=A0A2W5EF83_9SPHI|nr:MAG: hypothetical protein DI598_19755 [Pseudopedobacter saltans]
MTKRVSYIIFILLVSAKLFGQDKLSKADRINLYAYQIDTVKTKIDSFKFSFDSIQVDVKTRNNKIATTNFFEKSKSRLTVDYYFKDNELVLINVVEQCPQFDDLHSYSVFYYDKEKLIAEKYRHTIRPCLAIPMDKNIYELYGYNPALNSEFLKVFVVRLLKKIKTTGNNSLAQWRVKY